MKFFNNIGKRILKSSNSFNYYKKDYEKNKKKIKKLQKDNKELEKRIKKLEDASNTTNRLFNTIFLDYDLIPKPVLQNFIDLSMEYLIFIDKVCKKHDIKWMLEGGNILGAVRHDGFIPWDDDLDAGMMREDYNRFIDDVFPKELERNGLSDNVQIYFKKRQFEGETVYAFVQLFYKDSDYKKLNLTALDIFPYDFKKNYNGEDIGEEFQELREKFYRDMINGYDQKTLMERYYKNFDFSYEKQKYMIPGVEGGYGPKDLFPFTRYETDKIMPFKPIDYNGVMLPGPKDPDYYLKIHYKNYRNIPKVLTFHNRMKKLRKTPNINELLEKNIEKLKIINENFK